MFRRAADVPGAANLLLRFKEMNPRSSASLRPTAQASRAWSRRWILTPSSCAARGQFVT